MNKNSQLVINTVTILGASGTMGCNVAGILASFGNAKVYLVSRSFKDAEAAVEKAAKSVRASSIKKNLVPVDYSKLDSCIAQSDLVYESICEDIEAKKEVLRFIGPYINKNALVCTGTSGLSVNELSQALPEEVRPRFYGVHLFNPPYSLRLCELIPTQVASWDTTEKLRSYLTDVLLRTVIEVKDSPAFLGNRIGFFFINRTLQLAEEYAYSGGVDYIDAIFGPFTGRVMAPLNTADFVGLDIHKAIVSNIYENSSGPCHDAFVLPGFTKKLIDSGKLGRKTGSGLYHLKRSEDGKKTMTVFDIQEQNYRTVVEYQFRFAMDMSRLIRDGEYGRAIGALINNQSQEARICLELLLEYVVYALYIAKSVGENYFAADDAMAAGFNWCPPLALLEAIQLEADFRSLAKDRLDSKFLDSINLDELLEGIEPSKYDYRRFLRARRKQ